MTGSTSSSPATTCSSPTSCSSSAAARLYDELQAAGAEVLFDDRNERPGVKFMDADLIGLPLRVTVGDKSLKKGGAELKRRNSNESVVVALSEVVGRVRIEIRDLQAEIATRVMEVPFKD